MANLPLGARLLALSDQGSAYSLNGRLHVEAPGIGRVEMDSLDLDGLTEIDMLLQAAGDMLAENEERERHHVHSA